MDGWRLLMREDLIVTALALFRGKRSAMAAYHLLQGKRTIQTVQDGTFFNQLYLFGTLPQLTKEAYQHILETLETNQIITFENEVCVPTKKAKAQKDAYLRGHSYLYQLNGWMFGKVERRFWERFSLLIQSLNHVYEKAPFAPTTHNVWNQQWVRGILKQYEHDVTPLNNQLYWECDTILREQSTLNAELFVRQLSRPKRVGLTKAQLAQIYKLDALEVQLRTQAVIHTFCSYAYNQHDTYPVLSQCFAHNEVSRLTASANKTKQLLDQNMKLERIAAIRKLKPATVEDHVVEIAMSDNQFSIEPFVHHSMQKQIETVLHQQADMKLRDIRNKMGEHVSYFQIRLVLAKRERNQYVRA